MELSATLIAFVLVYFVVFGSGIVYMMRLIRVGPVLREGEHPVRGGPGHERTPMRPLSAADRRNTTRTEQFDMMENENGPLLVCATALLMFRALRKFSQVTPFLCALALVFLGYTGLGISLWPNIIPSSVTVWEASAPPQSQGFALVGALAIMPVILMYTAWSYYVFKGKVKHGEGYH
jgi:cytochrome bd-type quinol oxidase subunit 2